MCHADKNLGVIKKGTPVAENKHDVDTKCDHNKMHVIFNKINFLRNSKSWMNLHSSCDNSKIQPSLKTSLKAINFLQCEINTLVN